jgi:acyl-coenzyme A thioesterase PaaI-like protein
MAYTTLEFGVKLLAAIRAGDGPIRCEGRVVHRGSRVASAAAELTRESDERLLATGTSTCLIIGG